MVAAVVGAGRRACFISLGGAVSACKDDVHGGVVPDEEQEGVVGVENLCDRGRAHSDDSGGGRRSLRSLLVDLHVRLVDHPGEEQVVPG